MKRFELIIVNILFPLLILSIMISCDSAHDAWDFDPGSELEQVWSKEFDGNGIAFAKSIAIDSLDNIYVAGYGTNLVTGTSGLDWWIKKFDTNGNEDTVNWDKKFHGGFGDDEPEKITIDSSGNIYIVGYKTSDDSEEWWIKKFDANGNEDTVNWDITIDTASNDNTSSVICDGSGNVYVSGIGTNLASGTSGVDGWVKKFDTNGNEIIPNWNKSFNGDMDGDDLATSVSIDTNDNVYICGAKVMSEPIYLDAYILKYNSNGDQLIWEKLFDTQNNQKFSSLEFDNSGNFYAIGRENFGTKKWWHCKFSPDGTLLWETKFINEFYKSEPHSVIVSDNGGIYIAGWCQYNEDDSSKDWMIKKIDTYGEQVWTHFVDATGGSDLALSMVMDSTGNLYVAGTAENLINETSSSDWWILKFSEQ